MRSRYGPSPPPLSPEGRGASEQLLEPHPWRRALLWLLFLGPFFFASYGFATWVTSQRTHVGVIVFNWEYALIPFWPWTIVPYWLIDLLYGISLLLCATRLHLDNHAKRLLTAQLIAVSSFLLFPLRFSFERGPVAGAFGPLFDTLAWFDKPYNQAPSLHIALMVLLWVVYLRALPQAWRWLVHGVFALIGLSVLTTWQHHFFDVPTGLWLGGFCLWLLPDALESPLTGGTWTHDPARRRLGLRYALGASLLAALAIVAGGAALWLLWASSALALVALAYCAYGEMALQKRADGSLSPAARWLLAPYIWGAWINARLWTRGLNRADEIVPGLLLGRLPSRSDLKILSITAIVDVCAELPCAPGAHAYANVPMLDLVAPDVAQIERAVTAIEAARHSGNVLVCCALGFSRSALAVAAWLLATQRSDAPKTALARVRRARPAVVLGPAQIAALEAWWKQHRCGTIRA